MKVLSSGNTVLVYYESSHHAVNDGSLHIRFSNDYGQTWTAEDTKLGGGAVTGFPMNPPVSAGQDAGEPWLYLAANGDLILHMWRVDYGVSNGGTYQSSSSDGGETWSTPASAVDFSGITGDTNIFATDDDFVVSGNIYAAARVYTDATLTDCNIILIKSTDNGATWAYVSDITTAAEAACIEVGLEYLGSNTIIAMIRDLAHVTSYKRISTDLGVNWGTLTGMLDQHVGIAGRQRVYTLDHLTGNADTTTLIMVGFDHQVSGSSTQRRNCIWISLDAGETWSFPLWLDVPYEDGGYGDMIYDPVNDKFVIVTNRGTQAEGNLVQYNITINGLPA